MSIPGLYFALMNTAIVKQLPQAELLQHGVVDAFTAFVATFEPNGEIPDNYRRDQSSDSYKAVFNHRPHHVADSDLVDLYNACCAYLEFALYHCPPIKARLVAEGWELS